MVSPFTEKGRTVKCGTEETEPISDIHHCDVPAYYPHADDQQALAIKLEHGRDISLNDLN